MNDSTNDKSMYFEISTYENLSVFGKDLINIVSLVLNNLILPFGFSLVIDIQKINGRELRLSYNDANIRRVHELLTDGKIQHLLISQEESTCYDISPIIFSVTCDYSKEFSDFSIDYPVANSIAISINSQLYSASINFDIQKRWISTFKQVFTAVNGIYGFLTYDIAAASETPHESLLEFLLGLNYVDHSQNFSYMTRGYFWGNIITEGHIERLGGIHSIKKNAPCYRVDKISFGDREALYLQLTDDINNYSDNLLRELKHYLSPILPKEDMETIQKNDPFGLAMRGARIIFDY